jgi:transposase
LSVISIPRQSTALFQGGRTTENTEEPKKRGMHIERGFAHVLDCGALRRTALRGLANINKRYLCGILTFNLSLIMRKLTGVGTPRQAAAVFWAFYECCLASFNTFIHCLILKTRRSTPILTWRPAVC